jgi:hypothetical protein
MSYSTPTDVRDLFRNFAANPQAAIDDTKIQRFLDSQFSIINSKIGTVYALPVTLLDNPYSFEILKKIEAYLAADDIDDILNSYSDAALKPQWRKKALALLKDLMPIVDSKGLESEPVAKLPDATYIGTAQKTNQISINPITGTIFQKGVDAW